MRNTFTKLVGKTKGNIGGGSSTQYRYRNNNNNNINNKVLLYVIHCQVLVIRHGVWIGGLIYWRF
jgi:hypothetical protein